MKWFFSPQLPGQVETEVTQRDQFSNDEVQLSETIVREVLQNSLDAAVDDPARVIVSFQLVNKNHGLSSAFLNSIFEEQLQHAQSAGLEVDLVDFNNPSALVIEDFGTKGLTGSITEKDNDNFSDFWRRHGKSHKTGKSRGRWGLGKLVYSSTSQLGAFFGATVRENDPELRLMGQTVLNLREVNGREYPPHAFFADVEGEDSPYTAIPVPIKDPQLIEQFRQQFSLERRQESGLSVIIPFPNPNFSLEAMIGTSIANYFYPLTTGQLTLKFESLTVNSSSVRELAHRYAYDKFSDIDILFDFIGEVYDAEDRILLEMLPSWADDNKLDSDDFNPEDLESIRTRYSAGELVGLRLPLAVIRKDGTPVNTYFSVFIKSPASLTKGMDLYVRGGLTLPGEAKFRDRKALGAMIADDEEVCSFLGYAENAAHTQWIGSAEKLRKNYRNPAQTVKSIKHILVELHDLLVEEIESVDEKALHSFFWNDEPESSGPSKKKQKKTPIFIPEVPKPKPRNFGIGTVAGGFSIVSARDADKNQLPYVMSIEVAYDVATGNPFKKYSPLDFKLGKNGNISVQMTPNSGKLLGARENTLKIEVTDFPFMLRAIGFDENRDLKIKLQKDG